MIKKLLKKFKVKPSNWNPTHSLTLLQYAQIEDKETIEILLKHTKPSPELKTCGISIQPKHDTIQDFTFGQVIQIRNRMGEQIEEAVKLIYGISDLSGCDVYSYTSSCKWIIEEIETINNNEARLSNDKDKDLWKASGVEKLQGYGLYTSLFFASEDITQENVILALPYYRVFDRMEIGKDWSEIQTKFQKLKSEK